MFNRQNLLRLFALICLVLFVHIFFKLGPENIWVSIKKLSPLSFLILFFLRFLYWLFKSVIWKYILAQYHEKPSLWHLFLARLAGHAVGYLTPTAKLGGEAVRILMVRKVEQKKVFASVVVDKTIEIAAMSALFIAAVLLAILSVSMPGSRKTTLLLVAALLGMLVLWLLKKQKKGILIWLVDALKKLKMTFAFIEQRREIISETDAYITDFVTTKRGVFSCAFFLYIAHALFWTTEIYITFLFLGARGLLFSDVFLLVILGALSYSLPMVPASLGIFEITYISLFALIGIDLQLGLSVILVRRILGFIWAGMGMIPLLGDKTVRRRSL